ncbi:hypothetical protein [Chitinophaga cymbidii]|uniref:Uncharacterized protein n=1 Tax=Chitinophaga cymbidii TaxID=1096750 RepID=A0A512RMN2_9BACT|nr:hypothetical protein [Chitinophaga cymbidii]GEP96929.1 hypothetical protein CCY01nite_31890 [Chitinophaga cymbidii]
MEKRRDIEYEVESTLNSLDGAQRAEPGEFFFTRLQARMRQSGATDAWERFISIITRPSVAITGIALVLMLNAGLALTQLRPSQERSEQAMLQQAFADEYQLGIVTYYEYEKTEP